MSGAQDSRPTSLRVITLNIWQEQGPWRERLALTERRLRALAPDVVCLQEVREVPGSIPNQAETLAHALQMTHVYDSAQSWGGGDEGLAILSRHPIRSHATQALPFTEGRSRRIGLGAEVVSDWGEVWIFTTHLAYRLEDGALRERQVRAVDRMVRDRSSERPKILCGDFNATPDSDEIRYLRGLCSLEGQRTVYQDAFEVRNPGAPGLTWTHENPYKAQLGWFPSRRLDYVFVTPQRRDGRGKVRACRMVCTQPDGHGVWCSDHYGVMADIQIAPEDA